MGVCGKHTACPDRTSQKAEVAQAVGQVMRGRVRAGLQCPAGSGSGVSHRVRSGPAVPSPWGRVQPCPQLPPPSGRFSRERWPLCCR